MAKHEYERTCSRCGSVRYVPEALAKGKPMKQAKMVGWATPLVGKKRQAIQAERALVDGRNADLADAARCPACGSSSFKERKVKL